MVAVRIPYGPRGNRLACAIAGADYSSSLSLHTYLARDFRTYALKSACANHRFPSELYPAPFPIPDHDRPDPLLSFPNLRS